MAKVVFNNFTGGLANSKRVGKEGSFYRGKGVIVDEEPNVLQSGADFTIYDTSDTRLEGRQMSVGNGDVFSCSDNTLRAAPLFGAETFNFTVTSGALTGGLTSIVDTDSNVSDFYGYECDTRIDIARYHNSSIDKDWWSQNSGTTLNNRPEAIFGKNQRLYIADGNLIRYYDGFDGSFNSSALDVENEINFIDETGIYLAMASDNKVYFWNGNSPTWNFEVSFENTIYGIANKDGSLHVLTKQTFGDDNIFRLNQISNDLSSYTEVATLTVEEDVDGGSGAEVYPLTSDGKNLYFTFFYLGGIGVDDQWWIVKYGAYRGMDDILTVDHYKPYTAGNASASGKVQQNRFTYNSGSVWIAEEHTNGVSDEVLDEIDLSGHGSSNSTFETTVRDVGTNADNNYRKGRLDSIAVFFDDSASGMVTAMLDNTSSVSGSINGSSPYVLRAKDNEFSTIGIRVTGSLPSITRLEADYRLKEIR